MSQISDTTIAEPYHPHSLPLPLGEETRQDRENRPLPRAATISFGNREVDGLNVQASLALFLLLIVALVAWLHFDSAPPTKRVTYQNIQPVFNVESSDELVSMLKGNGLWDMDGNAAVPALILSAYPDNIDELDIEVKKRAFLHSLLPAALVALAEVEREKEALGNILAKFPGGWHDLVFSDDFGSWGRLLSMEEIDFVLLLSRKYRTTRARQLVSRVDVIPLSLLLAQAAIESSWGSSRFAREGNNLFGIWTWGEKGMVPNGREEGKTHKVAIYDSIIDSVRAYIAMLNRLPHYRHFREIRQQSRNPLMLAEGLLYYSERGDDYVWELRNIIESNDLHRYDDCFLVPATPSLRQPLKAVSLVNPSIGGGPA